jgi:hypothetical protein
MKTWVRKSLNVGVLSAGFLLVAGTAAHADSTTGTNAGAATGNQLDSKLIAPVGAEANSLGLFGVAGTEGASTEGAVADNAAGGDWTSGFNAGVLTGNQVGTTVQAPVNVSDNAVALLGFATAGGDSSESATESGATASNAGGGTMTTGTNSGVLTGNQASTVVQVPVNACGNAISVLGFADASCGGATATNGGGEGAMTTGFNSGTGTGNQITNVLQAPINLCGNAVAVGGFASADCDGGATATNGGSTGGGTGGGDGGTGNGGYDGTGNGGYGAGNSNGGYGAGTSNGGYTNGGSNSYGMSHAASAHGKAKAHHKTATEKTHKKGNAKATGSGASASGAVANNSGSGDLTTGTNAGFLTGNQLNTVVQTPVNVSHNAISLLGFASA